MHYSYYKRPLLWILIVYILGLLCFYQPKPRSQDVFYHISNQEVSVIGKVVSFPVSKKQFQNVVLQVESVNGHKAGGYAYARFEHQAPAWHETVEITGKLKKPYSISLEGNFDWGFYLSSKNIFTEIAVSQYQKISDPMFLLGCISLLRNHILQLFEENFERDLAAIAGGILLGERGEISDKFYTQFQDSGAIHLLVASGGNVAFVTLIVFALASLLGLSQRKKAFLALLIAGLYTLMAGADAPLTRAYFMALCTMIGFVLNRNSGVFQGLILSCFVILLFHPAALFETGFQMSFLATLAIVICLNNYVISYKWPKWIRFFAQIFLATLSTQMALLPVFTNVFYKISFVGVLSNMILVPLASWIMALVSVFYLFSLLHLGWLLKAVVTFSLWSFKELVGFFASFPLASVVVPAWKTGWIAVYYAGLFLLFNLPQKEMVRKIYKPFFLIIAGIILLQGFVLKKNEIWLLNEWDKNTILLQTKTGKRILIGPEIDGEKLIRTVLKSGSKKVDLVLINRKIQKQLKEVEKIKKGLLVENVIVPFKEVWPHEEQTVQEWKITPLWGINVDQAGKQWQNTGYSGNKDSISYQIDAKDFSVITAGNGKFILMESKIRSNQKNKTVRLDL